MDNRNRIIVKRAEMLALHSKYVKAMRAGQREIEKLAAADMAKQVTYRKIMAGLKNLKKEK